MTTLDLFTPSTFAGVRTHTSRPEWESAPSAHAFILAQLARYVALKSDERVAAHYLRKAVERGADTRETVPLADKLADWRRQLRDVERLLELHCVFPRKA